MSEITSLPLPKERNLYFHQGVDEDTVGELTKNIISINENDDLISRIYDAYDLDYKPKPIKVYIDSYGGQVNQILGLVSIFEASETPIHTIVTGVAMSAGMIMSISGHKRFAHARSTIMIHQLSAGAWGTLTDVEEFVEEMKRLQDKMESVIVEKTKIPKTKLKEIRDRKIDWYLDANQALELGLIDEII